MSVRQYSDDIARGLNFTVPFHRIHVYDPTGGSDLRSLHDFLRLQIAASSKALPFRKTSK